MSPDQIPVAEQIEHFYEEAREHSRRCECGVCDGLDGLHRIALRLLKENGELKERIPGHVLVLD